MRPTPEKLAGAWEEWQGALEWICPERGSEKGVCASEGITVPAVSQKLSLALAQVFLGD